MHLGSERDIRDPLVNQEQAAACRRQTVHPDFSLHIQHLSPFYSSKRPHFCWHQSFPLGNQAGPSQVTAAVMIQLPFLPSLAFSSSASKVSIAINSPCHRCSPLGFARTSSTATSCPASFLSGWYGGSAVQMGPIRNPLPARSLNAWH